jgi:hypothetical protein
MLSFIVVRAKTITIKQKVLSQYVSDLKNTNLNK